MVPEGTCSLRVYGSVTRRGGRGFPWVLVAIPIPRGLLIPTPSALSVAICSMERLVEPVQVGPGRRPWVCGLISHPHPGHDSPEAPFRNLLTSPYLPILLSQAGGTQPCVRFSL